MEKKPGLAIFIILLIILGIVAGNKYSKQKGEENVKIGDSMTSLELPIALDNPNVGSTLIHYFLRGTIQEVKNISSGSNQLILEDSSLPDLIISSETRISQITMPYDGTEPVTKTITDLKPGLNIDLSIEYDINIKQWFLRDVYLPK